jgi:transcription initiation factor TFIIH subunit 2
LFPVPNFTEVVVADVPVTGSGSSEGYKDRENEVDDTGVSENSSGVSSSSSKRPKPIDTVGPCFCSACSFSLQAGSLAARCPLCSSVFCVDCDIYVHDSLHVCPSCG